MNDITLTHDQAQSIKGALVWYSEIASMCRKATLDNDTQVALHVLKELALDGGRLAAAASGAMTERRHSPDPLSEALNSGDGSYRP